MCARLLLMFLFLSVASVGSQGDDQSFGKASWMDNALQGNVYFLPEGTQQLPDFSKLSPVGTIYTRTLNVPTRDWQEGFPGITNRFEWFAIEYTGIIRANRAGMYGLTVVSDDGTKIYVDDKLIVDNDGIHPTASASGFVDLDTNPHRIRIQYFQGPRYELALQLYCTPQGGNQALFPNCNLALETPGQGHSWWPWLLLLLVVIIGYVVYKRRRDGKKTRIQIVSPDDLTIQVCGSDIKFTARTDPPGREEEIQWDVPRGQYETVASGCGPVFVTAWTETGVKQVIAKIHDSGDDVLLYVFKTPGGTATLGDILDSAAPPEKRLPSDYQWYRDHDVPSDGESINVES